jgi:dienelactone hydrolase
LRLSIYGASREAARSAAAHAGNDQIEPVCKKLGNRATLKLFDDADHSFHVPARSGRKDAQVLGEVLDAFAAWLDDVIGSDVCKYG